MRGKSKARHRGGGRERANGGEDQGCERYVVELQRSRAQHDERPRSENGGDADVVDEHGRLAVAKIEQVLVERISESVGGPLRLDLNGAKTALADLKFTEVPNRTLCGRAVLVSLEKVKQSSWATYWALSWCPPLDSPGME